MIKLFLIKVNKIIVRDIALSCLVAVISDHSLVTSIPYRLVIFAPLSWNCSVRFMRGKQAEGKFSVVEQCWLAG